MAKKNHPYVIENPPRDANGDAIVTPEELLAYEAYIHTLALNFRNRNANKIGRGKISFSTNSFSIMGWTLEDIIQELRLRLWLCLKKWNPEKAVTEHGKASKHTYIVHCLNMCLGDLHKRLWKPKNGNNVTHLGSSEAHVIFNSGAMEDEQPS